MDTWSKIFDRHCAIRFRKLAILCEQQNYRCCYCGVEMIYPIPVDIRHDHRHASIEHVIPVSKGGRHGWDNLVAACSSCNMMRSADIEAEEFYQWRITQFGVTVRKMRKNIGQYRREKSALLVPPDTVAMDTLKGRELVLQVVHMKMTKALQLRIKLLLMRHRLIQLWSRISRSLLHNADQFPKPH